MQITLELPEDIAGQSGSVGNDLSRADLDGLALEGYLPAAFAQDRAGSGGLPRRASPGAKR